MKGINLAKALITKHREKGITQDELVSKGRVNRP